MIQRMALLAAALVLTAATAWGQGTPAPSAGAPPGPDLNPPQTPNPVPIPHDAPTAPGTIRPPVMDPAIRAQVPTTTANRGDVIPPPGTPGGNPNVVPK